MITLGKIAVVVAPIMIALFLFTLWYTCIRRDRRSCPHCGGDLIDANYGSKCPSCDTLYEDSNNDNLNIY